MKKNSLGYSLDFATQTLTLSAAFAEAANNPGSKEYRLVRQFQHDFPGLTIERKTHSTPTRYRNSDGSITTRNKHNGLTYERMENFIVSMSPKNDTDYLEAFYAVREKAENMCASPYAAVSAWFMKQFPAFRSNPLFYVDNPPDLIDLEIILNKMKRKPLEDGEKKTA